jgi:hypothetical protein
MAGRAAAVAALIDRLPADGAFDVSTASIRYLRQERQRLLHQCDQKKAENQVQLVSRFLVRVLNIERHYRRVYAD